MNDYKELIEVLNNAEKINQCGNGAFNTVLVERCYEAADAIEQLVRDNNVLTKERDAAREKQIAKKPNESMVSEYCVDWVCPCCERFHRTEWKMHYCSNCGQAIDWSDDE